MRNNSSMNKHRSTRPVNRDALRDVTPLFLRTEPANINQVAEASQPFLSLVNFIKKGKNLNEKACRHACSLLKTIAPRNSIFLSATQILFELVPKPNGSCCGFTESIVPLLISSNEEIRRASLRLMDDLVNDIKSIHRFDMLETGFFLLLPKSFYEQELHLLAQNRLFLMNIVTWFFYCSSPTSTREICHLRPHSMETFELSFMDKFIHPIEPFLKNIYKNRRKLADSGDSLYFSVLLGRIIESSPFLEKLTHFTLSSPVALACTDLLIFFETDGLAFTFLLSVVDGRRQWTRDGPAVRKRGHQIMDKLQEEGFFDEIELRNVNLGAQMIDQLGGNAPIILFRRS